MIDELNSVSFDDFLSGHICNWPKYCNSYRPIQRQPWTFYFNSSHSLPLRLKRFNQNCRERWSRATRRGVICINWFWNFSIDTNALTKPELCCPISFRFWIILMAVMYCILKTALVLKRNTFVKILPEVATIQEVL